MRNLVGEVDHEEVELLLEPLGAERVVEQEDEKERRAGGAHAVNTKWAGVNDYLKVPCAPK